MKELVIFLIVVAILYYGGDWLYKRYTGKGEKYAGKDEKGKGK